VRVSEIIAEVARLHDTTPAAIRGACRVPRVVEARRDAALRLRNRGLTLQVVGLALGARHHTTVMNLLREAA
jgi:chromosomal replication initiation ATPase DnaA